jgi:hypothetical protein
MNHHRKVIRNGFATSAASCLLLAWGLPGLAAEKNPIPDAEAQAKAEKVIHDVYPADFAKRESTDLRAVAARFLRVGEHTKDDRTARFVLLRLARDLAAQGGDARAALQAVDVLASDFAIDALEMKAATLAVVARSATTTEAATALVDSNLAVAEECMAKDNYPLALRVITQADTTTRKVNFLPLVTLVAARRRLVEQLGQEYHMLGEALTNLRTNPEDSSANLAVGRFYCFLKGDWARGLPMLAKSSDPRLQSLAENDASAERAPAVLGDAWWALADKEPGPARLQIQRHACSWYQKALAETTGLTRTRIEKRLNEVELQLAAARTPKYLRFRNKAYVELADSDGLLDLNGNFTIEMWVRWHEGVQYLVGDQAWRGVAAPVERASGWILRVKPGPDRRGALELELAATNVEWLFLSGQPVLGPERWHHLAVSKTPDAARLFSNGKLYAAKPCKAEKFVPCPSPLYLGVRKDSPPDRSINAEVRAFRVSGKALYIKDFSPAQTLDKTASTLVLLDFSLGQGKTIPDLSGHNHSGTLVGAEWARFGVSDEVESKGSK